jgi:hypothetical protein
MAIFYSDALDTVRTVNLLENDDEEHSRRVAIAQIMKVLLSGDTVVVSQTQAFDSSVILGGCIASEEEGPKFRKLIQNGYIQVRLFNRPNVIEAFRVALNNPEFEFSGWPEIATGKVERAAVLEGLDGPPPKSLPDALVERLSALKLLDEAVAAATHGKRAEAIGSKLLDILQGVAKYAHANGHTSAAILQELCATKSSDRSVHYGILKLAATQYDTAVVDHARSVVDCAYNWLVAHSLGAGSGKTALSANLDTVGLIISTISPTSTRSRVDVFRGEIDAEKLGWDTIYRFRDECAKQPLLNVEREAIRLRLLLEADAITGFRAVLPRVTGRLVGGLKPMAPTIVAAMTGAALTDTSSTIPAIAGGAVAFILGFIWGDQKTEKHILALCREDIRKQVHGLFEDGSSAE